MPRANRHYLPGLVWHITHRCHNRKHLLKSKPQKRCWLRWVKQARKRYDLRLLNYTITDNHVHLVAYDHSEEQPIAASMQLIAGSTAQRYNSVWNRSGAYWGDRYHATAVETGRHLLHCLAYIDLNMVRAGVVSHPCQWPWGGYPEIQGTKERHTLIDRELLAELLSLPSVKELRQWHHWHIEETLQGNAATQRNEAWSGSLAVGSEEFVRNVHNRLRGRFEALGRKTEIVESGGAYVLREGRAAYGAVTVLDNSYPWRSEEERNPSAGKPRCS